MKKNTLFKKYFYKVAAPFFLLFSSLNAEGIAIPSVDEGFYYETLYPEWGQRVRIDRILYEEKTDLQDLIIFENSRLGRVLALDGVIQLTEADEYVYHEMLVHTPLLAHGNVQDVLIIGGGDGGIAREVLKHPGVKRVVLVEIDPSVIELSLKWLPHVSQNAFSDPRLQVVIEDGAQFVRDTSERFDVVICDSTDPEGPAAVLFTSEFYGHCKRVLNAQGIFVNQNGVPFLQGKEFQQSYLNRKEHFHITAVYLAPVPTYVGGFMAFGWATDCADYSTLPLKVLEERLKGVSGKMRYYSPQIHQASFAIPPFLQEMNPL